MSTKQYEFKVVLSGYGKDVESAWRDAVDSFGLESGPPAEHTITNDDCDKWELFGDVVDSNCYQCDNGTLDEFGLCSTPDCENAEDVD